MESKVKSKKIKTKSTAIKKTVEKKTEGKAVTPVKKAAGKKEPKKTSLSLNIDVHNLEGRVTSTLSLPEQIFGEPLNKTLIAQAVRVYLVNQRRGTQSTKSRGEVQGSSRKIYRQKGTGRARHGSVRAPIFVHGGIAHGPKPREFSLAMPQKMKQKALFSALSIKFKNGDITVLTGLSDIKPKTKEFAAVLKRLTVENSPVLVVTPENIASVLRSARNIKTVAITPAQQLNTYDVIHHQKLILMKEAVEVLEKKYPVQQ